MDERTKPERTAGRGPAAAPPEVPLPLPAVRGSHVPWVALVLILALAVLLWGWG